MPFGLQPTHLIIILVVALLIFGPSRLPEIGRSFGKTIRELQVGIKELSQGFQEEVRRSGEAEEQGSVQVQCKQCGMPMQTGMKFCPECGTLQQA